jgi:hypothetical protein
VDLARSLSGCTSVGRLISRRDGLAFTPDLTLISSPC